MVTECSMADNVQAELPDVEFVRPCNLCPHMKRITLPKILDSLSHEGGGRGRSRDRRKARARGRAHDLILKIARRGLCHADTGDEA
jgi:quinolinate synthase